MSFFVSFMADDLPDNFVPRPNELENLIKLLLDDHRDRPKSITAALRGAGGYGKTTLALAVCHDPRIRKVFTDGILWVTLGEQNDDKSLQLHVESLIYAMNNETSNAPDLEAATARLSGLLEGHNILLVIDDVWKADHLKPFLRGGNRCVRLITTRNSATLPINAVETKIAQMRLEQAIELFSIGLSTYEKADSSTQEKLKQLATRLGCYPLLICLANGALRSRLANKDSAIEALKWVNKAFDEGGLGVFDNPDDQAKRDEAVTITLNISLKLLDADGQNRFKELAIFPEDIDIPLSAITRLWSETGGLMEFYTEKLCGHLEGLSLLSNLNLAQKTLRLHDVIRNYLRGITRSTLHALNNKFLNAYRLRSWADLPKDELYLWDSLSYHLHWAGRDAELVGTVKDGRYLVRKTHLRGTVAVERDLNAAQTYLPTDTTLSLLGRTYVNMAHLLNHAPTEQEKSQILYQRTRHLTDLTECWQSLPQAWSKPYIDLNPAVRQPLPDLPHPALIRTLEGHTDPVSSGVYSPDGSCILSASRDDTLKVWEASSGQLLRTLEGHTASVNSGMYSPDGTRILSASSDNTLKVWEASSGQLLYTLEGHTDSVSSGVYSPDGHHILSASDDNMLKVWEASSGQLLRTLEGHNSRVNSGVYSPDASCILSASDDNTLKVWEASSGQLLRTLEGHTDSVKSGVYSPDGHHILSASKDGTLKVWETTNGRLLHTLEGHTHWVFSGVYSPDGHHILSASSDNTLKVWKTTSGQLLHTLEGHTYWVRSGVYSPDGSRILSVSFDRTLKMWETTNGQLLHTLEGHINEVRNGVYSPDGSRILSVSFDRTLKLWETTNGQLLHTLEGHTGRVSSGIYSPDASRILSASWDRTLKVWEATNGRLLHTLEGHIGEVTSGVYSPDGHHILSASNDRTLKVWETTNGQLLHTLEGHTSTVRNGVYSPDGHHILSASDDNTLKVWDASNGQLLRTLEGHTSVVYSGVYSLDGSRIVSNSYDRTLRVWETSSGRLLHTLKGHTDLVYSGVFSPDGHHILSASWDKTLKVWETSSGQLLHTLEGHTDRVNSGVYSPDGHHILSASDDNTLKVWEAKTCKCQATFYVDGSLSRCAWHPDSEHLVAMGDKGIYWLRWVE